MTKLTLETGEDNWTALPPFALFHIRNTLGKSKTQEGQESYKA